MKTSQLRIPEVMLGRPKGIERSWRYCTEWRRTRLSVICVTSSTSSLRLRGRCLGQRLSWTCRHIWPNPHLIINSITATSGPLFRAIRRVVGKGRDLYITQHNDTSFDAWLLTAATGTRIHTIRKASDCCTYTYLTKCIS